MEMDHGMRDIGLKANKMEKESWLMLREKGRKEHGITEC